MEVIEHKQIEQMIQSMASEEHREVLLRFFKTGEGEYGAGDRFLGVTNPQVREVVARIWPHCTLAEVKALVHSPWHEIRLCGLLILVEQFQYAQKRRDENTMSLIFSTYTALYPYINSWDLVDLSAYKIVGEYEMLHPEITLMDEWIMPDHTLWQQRIAMVATWIHIRYNRYDKVIARATVLLESKEDLLHKAAGWMLRELYKHNADGRFQLEQFLDANVGRVPTVMFCYAIERLSDDERAYWRRRRREG